MSFDSTLSPAEARVLDLLQEARYEFEELTEQNSHELDEFCETLRTATRIVLARVGERSARGSNQRCL